MQRAPGIPHALFGREINANLGRIAPRGRSRIRNYINVIASHRVGAKRRLACGICDASAPGRADMPSANLTPASGRQDHTTSPYASASLVRVLLIAHGFKEPALRSPRAQNAAASTASLPASVTIMIRPSVEWDAKSSRSDLGVVETEIFLQRGLDTKLPDGQISRLNR